MKKAMSIIFLIVAIINCFLGPIWFNLLKRGFPFEWTDGTEILYLMLICVFSVFCLVVSIISAGNEI